MTYDDIININLNILKNDLPLGEFIELAKSDINFDLPIQMQTIDFSNFYPNFGQTQNNNSINTNVKYVKPIGMYNPITGKRGNKPTRNNNPGNITGAGGKLLYSAIAIENSGTGKDKIGDAKQLVFRTPQDGFLAMHRLLLSKTYSNEPLIYSLRKWQKDQNSYRQRIKAMINSGVNVNKRYSQMTPQEQFLVRKIIAKYEGWRGRTW